MADFSKCNNLQCPIKDTCWRHIVPNGVWQSWYNYEYKDGCDNFKPIPKWHKSISQH